MKHLDTSDWTCPMWQALITNTQSFEDRKKIIEEKVPAEFKDRVINHSKTFQAIKRKIGKKRLDW